MKILISAYHESLQDKLGQLKDAREALNALRDEHLENKRRQAFESERQRQLQLAVKLDDMRQKKHVSKQLYNFWKTAICVVGLSGISPTTAFTTSSRTGSGNASTS